MTDPQNDVPCRDCGRPTQHATEICDDCRTPAGRLVTDLRALGINGTALDSFEVKVGDLLVSTDPASWAICHESEGEDHDGNITSAAVAIAALADHASTIAALHDTLEQVRAAVTGFADAGEPYADAVTRLRSERDTLAAEVKRLTDRLEVMAGAVLALGVEHV